MFRILVFSLFWIIVQASSFGMVKSIDFTKRNLLFNMNNEEKILKVRNYKKSILNLKKTSFDQLFNNNDNIKFKKLKIKNINDWLIKSPFETINKYQFRERILEKSNMVTRAGGS